MNAKIFRHALTSCAALVVLALATTAFAIPIGVGVQFIGNTGYGSASLNPTDVAGVVPQANYNSLAGSVFSGTPLVDSNGAATSATLSVNGGAGNTWGNGTPSGTDQTLNSGLLNNPALTTFTVANVPYSTYSLIVYELDNSPRTQGTALGSTVAGNSSAVYLESPTPYPGSPGYTYLQGTSVDPANPTGNGNYVEFTNLHSGSLTFSVQATGAGPGDGGQNIFVNGFQIVNNTPEPSTFVLAALGLTGLLIAARRRRKG